MNKYQKQIVKDIKYVRSEFGLEKSKSTWEFCKKIVKLFPMSEFE